MDKKYMVEIIHNNRRKTFYSNTQKGAIDGIGAKWGLSGKNHITLYMNLGSGHWRILESKKYTF